MNQPPPTIQLSLRTDARNPDHHLWNNNGTWWCHFTLHTSGATKHRNVARVRRDNLLSTLQPQREVAA
jgi:hypothetical protein